MRSLPPSETRTPMPTEDWKYQISLALPERTPDATLSALYDIVEATLTDERERCARLAQRAQLPRGFQWGRDAMEQFNFGKERARKAILRGKADREP